MARHFADNRVQLIATDDNTGRQAGVVYELLDAELAKFHGDFTGKPDLVEHFSV